MRFYFFMFVTVTGLLIKNYAYFSAYKKILYHTKNCCITQTDTVVTTDLINVIPFLIAVEDRHFQDCHILCLVLALAHSVFTKCMQITEAPAGPGSVNTPLSERWAAAVRTAAGDEPDKAPALICRLRSRTKSQSRRESLDSCADGSLIMSQTDRNKYFRPRCVGA